MGSMSLVHWIIVGAVMLVLFGGRGKISDVMGDVAKGIKSFKKGLSDDDAPTAAPRPVEPPRAEPLRSIDQDRNGLREPVARESETRQVG
jgi:sec-independent protein translocase protein TatA